MIYGKEVVSLVEEFKIPYENPFCPEDWKDWYHYILYHPPSETKILYNVCFNGVPEFGYLTDTFYITCPKGFLASSVTDFSAEESLGYARNTKWAKGALTTPPLVYTSNEVNIRVSTNDILSLHVINKEQNIHFHLQGTPMGSPIYVPEMAPYGKGFIGWGVIPSYKMSGSIQVGARSIHITEDWYCYHDRNFGRFNWGNIGWTWFVARFKDQSENEWTYVLHQSNNPDHSKVGKPILFVHRNSALEKVFIGDTVEIEIYWGSEFEKPTILPGSMASVMNDRLIKKPKCLSIRAKDEKDELLLEMPIRSYTELVVPDSESRAYTYLKEMNGQLWVKRNLDGNIYHEPNGFFYAELVH